MIVDNVIRVINQLHITSFFTLKPRKEVLNYILSTQKAPIY